MQSSACVSPLGSSLVSFWGQQKTDCTKTPKYTISSLSIDTIDTTLQYFDVAVIKEFNLSCNNLARHITSII